jgi:hypothetical protein
MLKSNFQSQERVNELFITFNLKRIFRYSLLILVFISGITVSVIGQSMGIGSSAITPDPSSILELRTISKGLLIPRMSLANKNAISSPATGLLVYQTDATSGFYYYGGSSWLYVSSGGESGGLIKISYLKTAGSGVFTPNPSTTKMRVICVGGGGAGGGTPNDKYSTSGGGAAGAIVESYLTSISSSYNYSVAAAKPGSSNAAGNSGNNTTFSSVIGSGTTSLTAYGGGGGGYRSTGSTKIAVAGGAGVLGAGGDINGAGADGLPGISRDNGEYVLSGSGASTPYGSGGAAIVFSGTSYLYSNGNSASGYGAGGGGAATNNSSSTTMGGAGGQGLIIIYEYK